MRRSTLIYLSVSASIAVLATGVAISAQDKYTVKVPGGLAFSEFRGYEDWAGHRDQREWRQVRCDRREIRR